MRRALVLVGLVVGTLVPAGVDAWAGVPAQPPPACVVYPGRFEVTPIAGAHHAVQVSTVQVLCPKPTTSVVSHIRLMRYWVSGKVWTTEDEIGTTDAYEGQNQHGMRAINLPWYCATAGALMGLQVELKFYTGSTLTADVTYTQRTTAVCPAGPPQPPLGCVGNAGATGVTSIPDAHHAVQVRVAGDTCPALQTQVNNVISHVQLLRYWVTSKTWTVEREVLRTGATGAPAVDLAFYCNTPGALMGMRTLDHYYDNGVRILPYRAPLSFSDVTFSGSSTSICPI